MKRRGAPSPGAVARWSDTTSSPVRLRAPLLNSCSRESRACSPRAKLHVGEVRAGRDRLHALQHDGFVEKQFLAHDGIADADQQDPITIDALRVTKFRVRRADDLHPRIADRLFRRLHADAMLVQELLGQVAHAARFAQPRVAVVDRHSAQIGDQVFHVAGKLPIGHAPTLDAPRGAGEPLLWCAAPGVRNVMIVKCIVACFLATSFLVPAVRAATSEVNPDAIDLLSLEFGSLSLHTENDKYFAGTDRNYTNGFKLSALSTNLRSFRDRDLPRVLRNIADQIDNFIEPEREPKIGLSFGQNIYTPSDIAATTYQPDDRPYAAWLYAGASFHNYRPHYRRANGTLGPARADVFEVNLGMVGPAALGRQIQNTVHDLLGIAEAQGWAHQIHNEPGLNLIYEAKWRFSTRQARQGWGADLIVHAGLCLGNVFTYANTGAEVRYGFRMPDDFGPSLIRPTGDSNASRRARFNYFVFFGAEVRAIARDITLDGNSWRDSPSIARESLVHDIAGGIGFGTVHMQVTYTQARRSREFRGQAEPQDFGSLSLSYFF